MEDNDAAYYIKVALVFILTAISIVWFIYNTLYNKW